MKPADTSAAPVTNEMMKAFLRLRDCLARQQTALLARDSQQLTETTQALQSALDALDALPLDAPNHAAAALQRRTLQTLCRDIRQDAIFNRELITDSLACARMTLEAITPPESTYRRTQRREFGLPGSDSTR